MNVTIKTSQGGEREGKSTLLGKQYLQFFLLRNNINQSRKKNNF